MLWGHCIQYCYPQNLDFFEDMTFKTIYSFHMPLFMLISGYLFYSSSQKYSFKSLLNKKVSSLLQPIIMGGIFEYILTTVLFAVIGGERMLVLSSLKRLLNKITGLWFLWSVLAATIIMCLVKKTDKNSVLKWIILLLGLFVVALFPNRWMNVYMYPYFVIGYFTAKYKDILKRFDKLKYLSVIAFPLLMMFYEKKHFIYTSGMLGGSMLADSLIIDGYRWLVGLVGCIFSVTAIQLLIKIPFIQNIFYKVIPLGKKSLQIYVVSVVFLSAYLPKMMAVISKFGAFEKFYQTINVNILVYDCVFMALLAIMYAIALYWIVTLMEKIKLSKIVFGR